MNTRECNTLGSIFMESQSHQQAKKGSATKGVITKGREDSSARMEKVVSVFKELKRRKWNKSWLLIPTLPLLPTLNIQFTRIPAFIPRPKTTKAGGLEWLLSQETEPTASGSPFP